MAERPSGTVTFLFTDIEGSTTRWEHQRWAMAGALKRHDAILRRAIEAHEGVVFKTVGDAFYAVFARAPDALEAALAVQRALQTEPWQEVGTLRVRIALHTGAADERDSDYFGPPLNRVARLLAAGHGGQILLSAATHELVRDQLPANVRLLDLGEHRLKDLIRPERVFQLLAPDLQAEFPPLRTLDNLPNNLPEQRTPLIGREQEVAQVAEMLLRPGVKLVTLTGPGGTGKTRLALQVAADTLPQFPDGAYFVNLAPINDAHLVLPTIAQTLNVREEAGRGVEEILRVYLGDKHLLLLLDNFEQVVEVAEEVAGLLDAAPGLKVVVTSRVPLYLYGEQEYPVPPLALPDRDHLPSLEQLSQYEAVRLFIERAQAVKPGFQLTNHNAPAVAEICVRLDGLPLAIELAAGRSKLLAPHAILTRLNNRLKLLTGGARDLPARQQTLRAAIEWSYNLLEEAEQRLFRRLAVFLGGRTLEAIEAVCNVEDDLPDVFEGISSLVDKNLVRQEEGPDGEPRFVMLETIYEYAREQLATTGELQVLQQIHAEYFLNLAEQAKDQLTGPEQAVWLEFLEVEANNFRAALTWCMENKAEDSGLRLAYALALFWTRRGYLREGYQWLLDILALNEDAEYTTLHSNAFKEAGTLAAMQGDYNSASTFYQKSLGICQELQDKRSVAKLLNNLGIVARYQGDYPRARSYLEQGLQVVKELDDKQTLAHLLGNLGLLHLILNNLTSAREYLTEALALYRNAGERWGIGNTLHNLANVARAEGNHQEASSLYEESLPIYQELGAKWALAYWLEDVGALAALEHEPLRTLRLCGAASRLRETIGAPLPPVDRNKLDDLLSHTRQALDEAVWSSAWTEGRAMTLEEAVAYALEEE